MDPRQQIPSRPSPFPAQSSALNSSCTGCRKAKKKCAGGKPECERCIKLTKECQWPQISEPKGASLAKPNPIARLRTCSNCRQGKHRCDRNHPCSRCARLKRVCVRLPNQSEASTERRGFAGCMFTFLLLSFLWLIVFIQQFGVAGDLKQSI